jgi:hypothetical protein
MIMAYWHLLIYLGISHRRPSHFGVLCLAYQIGPPPTARWGSWLCRRLDQSIADKDYMFANRHVIMTWNELGEFTTGSVSRFTLRY